MMKIENKRIGHNPSSVVTYRTAEDSQKRKEPQIEQENRQNEGQNEKYILGIDPRISTRYIN